MNATCSFFFESACMTSPPPAFLLLHLVKSICTAPVFASTPHLQQLKPTSYARRLLWRRPARRLLAVVERAVMADNLTNSMSTIMTQSRATTTVTTPAPVLRGALHANSTMPPPPTPMCAACDLNHAAAAATYDPDPNPDPHHHHHATTTGDDDRDEVMM